MMEKQRVFIWVLFVLVGSCLGRVVDESKSLRVISPDSLKDVYECAILNLGVLQYGGTMFGTVVYPKSNHKGCKDFEELGMFFKSNPGGIPTFLLADRGDCYFALKAWRAQVAGAASILIADDMIEPLIRMNTPDEGHWHADYSENITIPTVIISKSLGDSIKKALSGGDMVNINLDWSESFPRPDERVEYELWTSGNYECGPLCDAQIEFIKNFKGAARILEQKGHTRFTPHYLTWYCPTALATSIECRSQCINRGRYCASDPEENFGGWFEGKDVVIQNLRQACVHKVANESGKPWLWWDYVTDFSIQCQMKEKKYTKGCGDKIIQSLGLDLKKIDQCIGDPGADVDNPVLKAEQEAQIGKGFRGDVTILPTLVVNNRIYRGKLDEGAVLKVICASIQETTKPALCSNLLPFLLSCVSLELFPDLLQIFPLVYD